MANIKLVFISDINGHETELECFANSSKQIVVSIEDTDFDHPMSKQFIALDIPSAIKLSKVLRTEINKIKDI